MNLFKVDGNLSIDTSNVFINGKQVDLSICNISDVDYYKLVIEDKCQDNVLYIISSNVINAYGQQIKNVAMPELSADAATKAYVDSQLSNIQSLTRNDVSCIAKDVFKAYLQNILSAL